ncbi:uncharacterized protein LACBIDRAFT_330670 [Laccaria bicolor S238N-H82]|uniref:Predicted protein n=1 Tax=Laccaria bicolor (strain S238N-H82 / ATCC MYA-4686) TaxID=486041 RepID=B0DM29_LACBS|nr:uncharacterized protein LACBIDRAFT_330670 [Laccaria bicolor S238N-H82]EDR04494.1 predicted protein [Laccaria bicolor S238N-H82]|eukprot:XP_001885013.1 predicted protein [Laccaria bicolor S238N-H82]
MFCKGYFIFFVVALFVISGQFRLPQDIHPCDTLGKSLQTCLSQKKSDFPDVFQLSNTIIDDINPLNYRLTTDNFITLTLPTGQLLYALDPATGTSLWWPCMYIPQFQFYCIAMERPAILLTLSPDCMNLLYGYTSQENIQAWFTNFQTMGRQAVQWICWNWETPTQNSSRLEFPNHHLIKGFDVHTNFNSYTLPSTCTCNSLTSDLSSKVGSLMTDKDIIMEDVHYGASSHIQYTQPMQDATPIMMSSARRLWSTRGGLSAKRMKLCYTSLGMD